MACLRTSGQREVSSMNSGQTKGDLTLNVGHLGYVAPPP
jgi:hypothetical protein